MKRNFKIVKVDSNYCDYLRKFDNKVPYIKGEKELKRQNLLKIQLFWLNNHLHKSLGLILRLYDDYKKDRLPENVKNRCCNFPLLEKMCKKCNKTSIYARIHSYF